MDSSDASIEILDADLAEELTQNRDDLEGTRNAAQKYIEEWCQLFEVEDYMDEVRRRGLHGELRNCRFRSVCWRLYLECLSEDTDTWTHEAQEHRATYTKLSEKLLTNPWTSEDSMDVRVNNPLSQETDSPWNQYFLDNELRSTIRQDVVRTFPEIEFFHSEDKRDMMVNILFCYAREYPAMNYRQGMHELLAPLIFVLHFDHQAFLHASELEELSSYREKLKVILDPAFLEHDAYTMFVQLIDSVEPWYTIREPSYTNRFQEREPFSKSQDQCPTNVIVMKLTRLHDQLLKKHDLPLCTHLDNLEIAPQFFGIRWLRLLFGREYPLQDLLVIWDAIFSDSVSFHLVDYIFVAMLMYIREMLLNSDYTSCLGILMRYPAAVDVHYIIEHALYLREPLRYPKPTGYSFQMVSHTPTVGGRPGVHRENPAPQENKMGVNKFFSSLTNFGKGEVPQRPQSLAVDTDGAVKDDSPSGSQVSKNNSKSLKKVSSVEMRPVTFKSAKDNDENQRTLDTNETVLLSRMSRNQVPRESLLVEQVNQLQSRVSDMSAMVDHCCREMSHHISTLEDHLRHQPDHILLTVAGLKQVRDILKGSLRFEADIAVPTAEEVIVDNDNKEFVDCTENMDSNGQISDLDFEVVSGDSV